MTDNLLIETKEIGEHRIRVYYDTDAQCPATDWDLCGIYLFEYTDSYTHRLSKECNYDEIFSDNNHSLEDALRAIISEEVEQKDIIEYIKKGNVDGIRLFYNRSGHLWELQTENRSSSTHEMCRYTEHEFSPDDLKNCDCIEDLIDCFEKDDLISLINDCAKHIAFKEWASRGYCQGDYLEGIAYVTKERYDKRCGRTDVDWKSDALKLIDAEVEEIGMWAWGDVKGFVLEKKVPYTKHFLDEEREDEDDFDWEEVDSCWGYFMETDDLIDEVIAEHGLKEAV